MKLQHVLLTTLALTALGVTFLYSTSTPSKQFAKEFTQFRLKYEKVYASLSETDYRYSVFEANLKDILAHPKDSTYTRGVNQFTDLTWDEFKSGFLMTPVKNSMSNEGPAPKNQELDWSEHVSAVKDQGRCGSCWAFASTAALEAHLSQNGDSGHLLSEQELVDCSRSYRPNSGCNGGLMTTTYNYIQDHGVAVEGDYPYVARDETCKRDEDTLPRIQVEGWEALPRESTELLSEWLTEGTVAVALEVNYQMQSYTGGVFRPSSSCGWALNHAVTLTGQSVVDGELVYRIKNSWGNWGEDGYLRMVAGTGKGSCGVANSWNARPVGGSVQN